MSADLTGRLFFQDWWFIQPDGVTPVSIMVDASADAATGFTAFRDSSAACADRTRGAEFDGVGRGDNGNLYAFTVAACDNGAAGSGADFFRIVAPDVPYDNTNTPATPPIDGTISSGDIVKEAEGPVPGTGNLTVNAATTGSGIPGSYAVTISGTAGTAEQSVPANGSTTFSSIPPDDYTVTLAVPTNCTVSGSNPRTVTVAADQTVSTDFAVTCTAAAGTGDLTITTSTMGEGPAGYTLSATRPDGSSVTLPLGANDTQSFPGQPAGDYRLELTDVPTNCTVVNGTNPRTVRVPDGGSVTTIFEITCTPQTGDLTIITSTTGEDLPAGYTLTVTGLSFPGGTSVPIGPNDTLSAEVTPGDYDVELRDVASNCSVTVPPPNPRTVSVAAGDADTTTFVVSCAALNQPPTADFSFNCNGLTCSFTSASSDPDGSIASYGWDFGDTTTSTAQNPSHTYAQGGTYTVSLTVTDNLGATATTSRSVTVTAPNQPPTANFTFNCNGLTCSFTSTSSDPDGSIASYSWNFGDNTTSIAQNPSHDYAQEGTYTVRLTVTDNRGGTNSVSKMVTLTQPNRAPSVNAGPDQTVLLGVLYSLSWSFSDPDNGPWSYTINWGDGTSSSGSKSSPGSFSASHNYLLIGSNTIRVTVTDSRGASGSDTKVLTVLTPLPGLP